MNRIQWSPQMELGIAEIDESHKAFVGELNAICQAPDAEFSDRMQQLIAKIEKDFFDEERLMEEIDFPAMKSHCEQHARVLSGLHHAMSRVMSGDLRCGRDAIQLLFDWFQVHLNTMDLALSVAADAAAIERAFPKHSRETSKFSDGEILR